MPAWSHSSSEFEELLKLDGGRYVDYDSQSSSEFEELLKLLAARDLDDFRHSSSEFEELLKHADRLSATLAVTAPLNLRSY